MIAAIFAVPFGDQEGYAAGVLSKDERKRAAEQFKTRTPNRGVYAVRCESTGCVWVGSALDLRARHNRLWLSLRQGAHREGTLQAAWIDAGEDAFRFEVLETLDPDVIAMGVADLLKEKRRDWAAQLGAELLL